MWQCNVKSWTFGFSHNFTYYSGIIPNSFYWPLFSKLFWHNFPRPSNHCHRVMLAYSCSLFWMVTWFHCMISKWSLLLITKKARIRRYNANSINSKFFYITVLHTAIAEANINCTLQQQQKEQQKTKFIMFNFYIGSWLIYSIFTFLLF